MRDPVRAAIQVDIDMDGCPFADNGSLLHAHIGRSDLAAQIDKLAPASRNR